MPKRTHKRSFQTLVAAATGLTLCAGARATQHESVTLTDAAHANGPINSKGGFNNLGATNQVVHATFVGNYVVRSVHITATLRAIPGVSTKASEASLIVRPPAGAGQPFVLQPTRGGPLLTGTDGQGVPQTFTDYVLPLNVPISSAAGQWTFQFFESTYNNGFAGGADAQWTNFQLTLDDEFALPTTATVLPSGTPGFDDYVEVEPNDDAYLRPNVIRAMAPSDALSGATGYSYDYPQTGDVTDCNCIYDTSTSADFFVIGTATLSDDGVTPLPLAIYRHALTLVTRNDSCSTGQCQGCFGSLYISLYGTGQYDPGAGGAPMVAVGGKGSDSLQLQTGAESTDCSFTRTAVWYGFGRGEHVTVNMGSDNAASIHNYDLLLSRDLVTPQALSGSVAPGLLTFSKPSGGTWSAWVFDANLQPLPAGSFQGTGSFSLTLPVGVYFVALHDVQVTTSLPAAGRPNLSPFGTGPTVLPYPDAVAAGGLYNNTTNYQLDLTVADSVGGVESGLDYKTGSNDLVWFKLTVGNPVSGVCCRGATCSASILQAACTASTGYAGAYFAAGAAVCNSGGDTAHPCCYPDYNKVNGVSVQDIFDFLNDWFAGSPYALTGSDGTGGQLSVQNIFDFLNGWFAGC
jgi:hypothetical protein